MAQIGMASQVARAALEQESSPAVSTNFKDMKTPKKRLTASQSATLAYLSQHPSGDYYDLRRAGSGGGATTTKLTSLGLIEQIDEDGTKSWRITENGIKAFAVGRYLHPEPAER